MYAKNIIPSPKREVQTERSAEREAHRSRNGNAGEENVR